MRVPSGILLILSLAAFAQPPLVYIRGVVNAGSFMPQGLPGGGIARGSIFSIFGARLGPAAAQSATSFPLGTTLANVSVTVSASGTTVNAIPVYVSAGQINAIMPSNTPLGAVSLRVSYANGQSNPVPVQIADNAFGIFTANGAGSGPGILQNFIAQDNQPINAPAVPAQPGQTIILWGTGLGPVANDAVAPTAGNLKTKVEVFVGGKPATVAYSGRTPCCSGTDQIVFTVPPDTPLGCWVPVWVRTDGANVSNFVTMAVEKDTSTCTDTSNPFADALVNGKKAGGVAAVRVATREDVGVTAPIDVTTDLAMAAFSRFAQNPFAFNSVLSLPPQGTCAAYNGKADWLSSNMPGWLGFPAGQTLDAGSAPAITGPGSPIDLLSSVVQGFAGKIVGAKAGSAVMTGTTTLDPGTYTVTGGPGADVGSFQATLNVPSPMTWTNRDQLTFVNRSAPLTVSWSGGAAGDLVALVGIGLNLPSNSGTTIVCVAAPGATSITVPADVLANVPPTRQAVLNSTDALYLVSVPQTAAAPIHANGLDSGTALFGYLNGKTVIFQ